MKLLFYFVSLLFLSSCAGNTVVDENCQFLLDINVQETVNLSLPKYSQLPFAGNSVYIENVGNGGIIVASTGFDFYAWDASDPNQVPSACSILVPSGLEATGGCNDENEYSLITGAPTENPALRCSLKPYRVEQNGDNLLIYN
ncbi:hypothetical protein N1F78_07740 [Seonamhaeicola sp. MEBiC1930]|uniref:hypothetical protein n=1 Tax=Seonamhaeicola sp. MEBiC01930 TaxID=2976768 RepID=UPI0032511A29